MSDAHTIIHKVEGETLASVRVEVADDGWLDVRLTMAKAFDEAMDRVLARLTPDERERLSKLRDKG